MQLAVFQVRSTECRRKSRVSVSIYNPSCLSADATARSLPRGLSISSTPLHLRTALPTVFRPPLPPTAPIVVLISLEILVACFTEAPYFGRSIWILPDVQTAFDAIYSFFYPCGERNVGLVLDCWAAIADFEVVARNEKGSL